MTSIEPMPQEIALAHAGRIEFLFQSQSSSPEAKAGNDNAPKLVMLAEACGLKPEHYASNHSLMPFLRMVAKGDRPTPHGQAGAESLTRRLGTAVPGKLARICVHCVNDDLSHWHFSWYRRTHQLPGINWCPVHRLPLVAVENLKPWTIPPHHWVEKAQIRPLQTVPEEIAEDGFLGRLVEIACDLMERPAPLPVAKVGAALTERVQQMGLRTCRNGTKPLLSDLVREKAPRSWLDQHWNGLTQTKGGQIHHGLDRVVSRTVPATGLAYVTALAAMFESASDALNFFTSVTRNKESEPNPTYKRGKVRPSSFWEGELWPLYERCEGKITDLAQLLEMDRTYLAEKLHRYGMPSLKDCETDPRWMALLQFRAGASFSAACTQENVDIEAVEALLRRTSPRVIDLVRTIIDRNRTKTAVEKAGVMGDDGQEKTGRTSQLKAKQKTPRSSVQDEAHQLSRILANSP